MTDWSYEGPITLDPAYWDTDDQIKLGPPPNHYTYDDLATELAGAFGLRDGGDSVKVRIVVERIDD